MSTKTPPYTRVCLLGGHEWTVFASPRRVDHEILLAVNGGNDFVWFGDFGFDPRHLVALTPVEWESSEWEAPPDDA